MSKRERHTLNIESVSSQIKLLRSGYLESVK